MERVENRKIKKNETEIVAENIFSRDSIRAVTITM